MFDGVVFSACGALQLVPGLGSDGSQALHALRALRQTILARPPHPA